MKYKKFQHNQKSEGLPQGPNHRQTNEFISTYGYSDFSPFRNQEYLDIYSPNGVIDMSNTGIPLLANGGRYLPPYSGLHQFDTPWIREEKFEQGGAYLPKANVGLETPPKNNNVFDIDAFTNKTNELDQLFKQGTVDESDPLVQDALKEMWADAGFDSESSIFQNEETGEYDPSKVYKTAWSGATINELTKSLFGKPQWSTAHAKAMKKMYSGESVYDKPFNLESTNNEFEVGDVLGRGRKGWKDWKVDDFEKSFAKGEEGQLSHFDIIVGKGKDSKGTYYETAGGNRRGTAGGTFKKSKVYYDPETKKLKNSNYIFGSNVKGSYRGAPLDEGASDQVVTEGSTKKLADSRGYTDEQRDEYLKLLQSDGVNTQQQRQPIATNIPMIPMNQNMQPRFSNVTADMIKNRRGPLGGRKFKAKNISISQKGGPTYDFTNNQLAQREVGGDYLDNSYKNSKLYNMGGNIQNQSIDSITSQNADRFKNYLLDTSNQYKMNEMQKLIQESGVSPEMMMNLQGYMKVGGNWLDAYNRGMANQQNLFTSGINDIVGNVGLVDSDKVKVRRKKGLDKTLGTKWFEFGEKGRRNRAAKDSFGMAAQNLGYLNEGYNNRDIKKLGMKNFMDVSRQMAAGRDDQGNIISPDMYAGAYGQSYDFPMAYGGVPPMMNYGGDYYDYRNGGAYLPMHQVAPGETKPSWWSGLWSGTNIGAGPQSSNVIRNQGYGPPITSMDPKNNPNANSFWNEAVYPRTGQFSGRDWGQTYLGDYINENNIDAETWQYLKDTNPNIEEYLKKAPVNDTSFKDLFKNTENLTEEQKYILANRVASPIYQHEFLNNQNWPDYQTQLEERLTKNSPYLANMPEHRFNQALVTPYDKSQTLRSNPNLDWNYRMNPSDLVPQGTDGSIGGNWTMYSSNNSGVNSNQGSANTNIPEVDQDAILNRTQEQLRRIQDQGEEAQAYVDAQKEKNKSKSNEAKKEANKETEEAAVNPNVAPTSPGGWQYSPFFNAGKIVNRRGPFGGYRNKMKDVSFGYTPFYAGSQGGMAAPQSDLDPRLQDYYMNNANRVVNPRQSVDPRDPRSGGFGDRLREGVANIAGGIRDRFSDIEDNRYLNKEAKKLKRANKKLERSGAGIRPNRYQGYSAPYVIDDVQEPAPLPKPAPLPTGPNVINIPDKETGRERRKRRREGRRGSKAYGGEQYYGAGGPFGHIPMQDYGMGGGYNLPMHQTMGETWAGNKEGGYAPWYDVNNTFGLRGDYVIDRTNQLPINKDYPVGTRILNNVDEGTISSGMPTKMSLTDPRINPNFWNEGVDDMTDSMVIKAYGGEQYKLGQEVYLDGGQVEDMIRKGYKIQYF